MGAKVQQGAELYYRLAVRQAYIDGIGNAVALAAMLWLSFYVWRKWLKREKQVKDVIRSRKE